MDDSLQSWFWGESLGFNLSPLLADTWPALAAAPSSITTGPPTPPQPSNSAGLVTDAKQNLLPGKGAYASGDVHLSQALMGAYHDGELAFDATNSGCEQELSVNWLGQGFLERPSWADAVEVTAGIDAELLEDPGQADGGTRGPLDWGERSARMDGGDEVTGQAPGAKGPGRSQPGDSGGVELPIQIRQNQASENQIGRVWMGQRKPEGVVRIGWEAGLPGGVDRSGRSAMDPLLEVDPAGGLREADRTQQGSAGPIATTPEGTAGNRRAQSSSQWCEATSDPSGVTALAHFGARGEGKLQPRVSAAGSSAAPFPDCQVAAPKVPLVASQPSNIAATAKPNLTPHGRGAVANWMSHFATPGSRMAAQLALAGGALSDLRPHLHPGGSATRSLAPFSGPAPAPVASAGGGHGEDSALSDTILKLRQKLLQAASWRRRNASLGRPAISTCLPTSSEPLPGGAPSGPAGIKRSQSSDAPVPLWNFGPTGPASKRARRTSFQAESEGGGADEAGHQAAAQPAASPAQDTARRIGQTTASGAVLPDPAANQTRVPRWAQEEDSRGAATSSMPMARGAMPAGTLMFGPTPIGTATNADVACSQPQAQGMGRGVRGQATSGPTLAGSWTNQRPATSTGDERDLQARAASWLPELANRRVPAGTSIRRQNSTVSSTCSGRLATGAQKIERSYSAPPGSLAKFQAQPSLEAELFDLQVEGLGKISVIPLDLQDFTRQGSRVQQRSSPAPAPPPGNLILIEGILSVTMLL